MNNDGDQVTRTYDYTINGPRRGEIAVSSAEHQNYAGTTMGGGAQLTKTASGWNLAILGKNKVLSRGGQEVRNKSLRTLADLEITGGLRRANRRVANGQLEVSNNTQEFTAVYTASDIGWTSDCCHPVSGTFSVEFSGSKTGSGTVTFNSCGDITVEVDGEVQNDTLTYCE